MHVRVFRNLTRGLWSIQARDSKGWKTIAHAEEIILTSARFHVSQAGRLRVLKTGKKDIHAWIEGNLAAWSGNVRLSREELPAPVVFRIAYNAGTEITYNPKKYESFVNSLTKAPIYEAEQVNLTMHPYPSVSVKGKIA